jgi:2-amino-4-hydroxy-6-hydroxymethyldihydropteridine diphosphokinase
VKIECFVALGANLGDPLEQLESALAAIQQIPQCSLVVASPWYRSKAIGPGTQPDYINGVAQLETRLSPHSLLAHLQAIENLHGRLREQRWAARTLDLDILLYGDITLDSDELQLPHPRMQQRNFVLYPLFDLVPQLTLPCGTPLESLLASCSNEGLQRLGDVSDPGL